MKLFAQTLTNRTQVAAPLMDAELSDIAMIETRIEPDGRLRFRLKGVAMAWCSSMAEAMRVGHILIRAGCQYVLAPAASRT